jgi:methyl-accepting chemotaxis protein
MDDRTKDPASKTGWRVNLRYRLIVYFLLLSIIPFGIASFIAYKTISRGAENSVKRELKTLAQATIHTLDGYLNDRVTDMIVWSKLTIVREAIGMVDARQDTTESFEELVQNYRAYDAILMLDDTGTCIVSSWNGLIGEGFSEAAFFRTALKGKVAVTDLHRFDRIGELSPESEGLTLAIAAPVEIKGNVGGVLVSFLKWRAIEDILQNVKIGETGHIVLLNAQSEIIGGANRGDNLGAASDKQNRTADSTEDFLMSKAPVQGAKHFAQLGWSIAAVANVKEMLAFLPEIVSTLEIVAILISLAVVGCAILFSGTIVKPIALISGLTSEISSGDLTAKIPDLPRQDEIGTLGKAFRDLADNLRDQIRNTIDAVSVLSSSAAEISSSISQVTGTATEISTAISQTSTTVEELEQAARVSSEKAKSVAQRSQNAVETTVIGKSAVEDTIERVTFLKNQMGAIGDSILRLGEYSDAIREAIEAVQDLADQSKILAVNASIEAARAGDHGRGFSVVATEIGALAVQSKDVTARVSDILQETTKLVSAVVTTTEEGNRAIGAVSEQSLVAVKSIQSVASEVKESAQAAGSIDESIEQQSLGFTQVAHAMGSIEESMQQYLESTAQLETAAQSLEELRNRFAGIVEGYRV